MAILGRNMHEQQESLAVLDPRDDNRVPGELLIKLSANAEQSVTESIPSGTIRTAAMPAPTSLGLKALDKALAAFGVESIVKVHSPVAPQALEAGTLAFGPTPEVTADLAATYRVVFVGKEVDLDEATSKLSGLDQVIETSPNRFRFSDLVPNDPMYSLEWGLEKINCPAAWDRSTGSSTTVVAVIDTGIDLDHPDLLSQLVPGRDLVDLTGVTPATGFRWEGDFLTRDDDPQDEVGHGTHVAGTIAAATNNGVGVSGVAWSASLMPVRVLARLVRIADGYVSGSGTAVDIAAGIRWAVDHGAHIINMSLGGSQDTFVERDAVAYAIAQGVLVVAAMGNANSNLPSYPAAYPNVVAVGAIDANESRAGFSNFGPHIDVAAPGVNIRSTYWDNTYTNLSGTSMATPHVAGVAVLVRSCNPALGGAGHSRHGSAAAR